MLGLGHGFAQVPHDFQIDSSASIFRATGITSLGAIDTGPNDIFSLNGSLRVNLAPSAEPLQKAQFVEGVVLTDPMSLNGEVPNPIPGFPPLVHVSLQQMVFSLESSIFQIQPPNGTFQVTLPVHVVGGIMEVVPWQGIPITVDLSGETSQPTLLAGSLQALQSHWDLQFPLTADFIFADFSSGFVLNLSLAGDIRATAAQQVPPMNFSVEPNPLQIWEFAEFTVRDSYPDRRTFLFASKQGLGQTFIPELNITLGLIQPVEFGRSQQTNVYGNATWELRVPPIAAGRTLWFQAGQTDLASTIEEVPVQ